MALLLYERMQITPHQAADEEIWAHLTAGPFAALAAWRFPGLPDERVLGRAPRNTFRRLWWRAEILGPRAWDQEGGLLEDETVQIMERTGIAASPLVARALADAFTRRAQASPGLRRMELMRDAMKRVNRLTPFVVLEALPTGMLTERLDAVFEEAAMAIGKVKPVAVVASVSSDEDAPEYLAEPSPGFTAPAAPDFTELQLGLLMESLVNVVVARGAVADAELGSAFAEDTGIEVSAGRERLLRKMAWSAKGRRQLRYDEESGRWTAGEVPGHFDERFGNWTFAEIVDRAAQMLADEADPFDRLVGIVGGEARAPRIVASIVGSAVNEARREVAASR
jgi:Family of unknown function (DUF6339)